MYTVSQRQEIGLLVDGVRDLVDAMRLQVNLDPLEDWFKSCETNVGYARDRDGFLDRNPDHSIVVKCPGRPDTGTHLKTLNDKFGVPTVEFSFSPNSQNTRIEVPKLYDYAGLAADIIGSTKGICDGVFYESGFGGLILEENSCDKYNILELAESIQRYIVMKVPGKDPKKELLCGQALLNAIHNTQAAERADVDEPTPDLSVLVALEDVTTVLGKYSLRSLHERVGATEQFSTWAARILRRYNMEIIKDYTPMTAPPKAGKGRRGVEYLVSSKMARKIVKEYNSKAKTKQDLPRIEDLLREEF
jgi:phage anti-repressor protein